MGRVQQKHIESSTKKVQRNSCQENGNQNNHPRKKLSIRSELATTSSAGKCNTRCQSVHHLKNAIVKLEDIGIHTKRTVLGDKTNRSPMSSSNRKQNEVYGSPDLKEQKKILNSSSDRMNKEKYVNSMQEITSEVSHENLTKSPMHPDKCIYSKVQRETMRNKNMPLEEKLAQYVFEVDENEPIVKKKKKRNVKHKKKVKPKEEYCPPAKVLKKIFRKVEEAAEKMKDAPKNANDLNCRSVLPGGETCHKGMLGCEVLGDASPLVVQSVGKRARSFAASDSPVAWPNSPSSMRGLRELAESEVCVNESSTINDEDFLEKSHCKFNLNDSVDSLGEALPLVNRHNHESHQFKSPIRLESPTSLNNTISTPIQNVEDLRFPFPGVTSTSTPMFRRTPLFRNSQTVTTISARSSAECSVNHSVNMNKKGFITPRESGGVNNLCNEALTKNWSVENCFGFDDGKDTTESTSFITDISSNQRLRNTTIFSSMCSGKRKQAGLNSCSKTKLGTTVDNKSSKFRVRNVDKSNARLNVLLAENYGKESNASEIECTPVTAGLTPYSSPLKQSRLDFIANQTRTATTPEQTKRESPLLFKDPDNETPVHFSEPARRSYIRSFRKKMRPVGREWIEFDSESEGEEGRTRAVAETKKKRAKFNKQEEKEANKWMKDFNRQCEEIDGFELCVEK